jgi:hypothetical protein
VVKGKTPDKTKPAEKTFWALAKINVNGDSVSVDVFNLGSGNVVPPGDPAPIDFRDQFTLLRYGHLAISERLSFPIIKTQMFGKVLGFASKLATLVE